MYDLKIYIVRFKQTGSSAVRLFFVGREEGSYVVGGGVIECRGFERTTHLKYTSWDRSLDVAQKRSNNDKYVTFIIHVTAMTGHVYGC